MARTPFQDKICIVTGAGSGLGRELCGQLAASGARVVAADIDAASAAETVQPLADRASSAAVDVTDPAAVQRLVEDCAARYGRLDYIFNNAGIAILGEIRDLSLADWRKVLDVNLYGVIHGVHAAYPLMIRQGFGHIVNTASLAGRVPSPTFAPYGASKHAVFGLSRALAAEARDLGVRVSVVCPGFVQTPLLESPSVNVDRQRFGESGRPRAIPVDVAVRKILAGVARGDEVVAFPASSTLALFLDRFVPPAFRAIQAATVRRFRQYRLSA